jgi:hypothetical protein
MAIIREMLPSSMPRLGEAGQPGYLVLTLARQQMIVPTLQTLLPSQRNALARDWQAGYTSLRNVRQVLRQELRIVCRRRGLRHGFRLLSTVLRDYPGVVLLVMVWITLNVASEWLRQHWDVQVQVLICLLALLAMKLAHWFYTVQPVRIHPKPPPTRRVRSTRPRARVRRQPNSSHA